MIRRHRDGDVEGARALHEEQQPAYDLLRIQTNPIPIKAALNLTGHEVGGHRLPMVEPDEGELAQIRSCLERPGCSPPPPRKRARTARRGRRRRTKIAAWASHRTGSATCSTRSSRASRPVATARRWRRASTSAASTSTASSPPRSTRHRARFGAGSSSSGRHTHSAAARAWGRRPWRALTSRPRRSPARSGGPTASRRARSPAAASRSGCPHRTAFTSTHPARCWSPAEKGATRWTSRIACWSTTSGSPAACSTRPKGCLPSSSRNRSTPRERRLARCSSGSSGARRCGTPPSRGGRCPSGARARPSACASGSARRGRRSSRSSATSGHAGVGHGVRRCDVRAARVVHLRRYGCARAHALRLPAQRRARGLATARHRRRALRPSRLGAQRPP